MASSGTQDPSSLPVVRTPLDEQRTEVCWRRQGVVSEGRGGGGDRYKEGERKGGGGGGGGGGDGR